MDKEIIQNSRILIVDDQQANIVLLERILQQAGYSQLARVLDSRLVIDGFKTFQPDLILLDLMMPQVDGFSVMTQLRSSISEEVYLPILVITADVTPAAKQRALSVGAKDFLTKPVDMTETVLRVYNLLETRWLYRKERELLERTLRGSIGILSEILSLVNPSAFSRAHRIRRYVQHMAERLRLADRWQYDLAAMLSQVGCVAVPPDVLNKSYRAGATLSATEQDILSSQPHVGYDLLSKIPRLEQIATMVAGQRSAWSDMIDSPELVRVGAHLLKVALDFDELIMRGATSDVALRQMYCSKAYQPDFVGALQHLQTEESRNTTRWIPASQLEAGMIIKEGVHSRTGLLLLSKGQEVTESAIARLKSFASLFGIVEPLCVTVPAVKQPLSSGETRSGFVTSPSEPSQPRSLTWE